MEASGEKPNPFYNVPEIKTPVISPEAGKVDLNLKKVYLYDLETKPGNTYILTSADSNEN